MDTLPFDLFHYIASLLSCHDYVQLSRVNKRTARTLKDESIAKVCVKYNIARSHEALLAQKDECTYRSAIFRTFQRQDALATARPYSISVVAQANAFIYQNGHLCYFNAGQVRILDIRSLSTTETVLDVTGMLKSCRLKSAAASLLRGWKLLSFSHTFIVCQWRDESSGQSYLIVADISSQPTDPKWRCRSFQLSCTKKLFVKVGGSFICYGTFSGARSNGHQWIVHSHVMGGSPHEMSSPVVLEGIYGSEVGSTVAFEIFGNNFYAVSTQNSPHTDEVDWVSYYDCVRIQLDDPKAKPLLRRIWRRDHVEGPIMDSWVELALRQNEHDEQPLIVECRKEYPDGGSFSTRICYTQPLNMDLAVLATEIDPAKSDVKDGMDFDAIRIDDGPARKRLRREVHYEHPLAEPAVDSHESRNFILARTYFRTYDPASMSFIDFVEDEGLPCQARSWEGTHMTLRIGSRKRKSPYISSDRSAMLRPLEHDEDNQVISNSDEDFTSTRFSMWPPRNAARELRELLRPPKQKEQMNITADDRSMLFTTDLPNFTKSAGAVPGLRAVVLISFDPMLQISDLLPLRYIHQVEHKNANQPLPLAATQASRTAPTQQPKIRRQGLRANGKGQHKANEPHWTEPAKYLSIQHGFRLR